MLEDRVELPRLYLAWHSPALFGDGRRRARSRRRRAGRRQDVAAVSRARLRAAHRDRSRGVAELARAVRLLPGRRDRRAGPHAGRSSSRRSRRRSQRWLPRGPTAAEMERGLAQAEAHFISRLQTVGGFGGKSDQLNAYNVFLGDPGFFDRDLARYRAPTAADLTRAARAWLGAELARGSQRRAARTPGAGAPGIARRCRCPDGGRSQSPAAARRSSAVPVPGDSAHDARQRPARLDDRAPRRAADHRARRCSVAGRRPILPAAKASRRSPATCWTKAAATLDALDVPRGARADRRAARHRGRADATLLGLTMLARFADRGLALLGDMIRARGSSSATSIASAICV